MPFRLLFGTPVVRVDLVSASENLSEREERDYGYPPWKRQIAGGGSFGAVPILGVIQEIDWNPRSSDATDCKALDTPLHCIANSYGLDADNGWYQIQWNGTFANGSIVGDGEYKMLLRALKMRGNPSNEADYETWLSPIFAVSSGSSD